MAQGKQTCKILKEIRQQIAEANDIEFVTSECRYNGDCPCTCPKCEAEVRYLEQQLRARRFAGKSVTLAGISIGALSMMMPMPSTAQASSSLPESADDRAAITHPIERATIKGRVFGAPLDSNVARRDTLIGAHVLNLTTQKGTLADIDGCFEIKACRGDSVKVSFIGYDSQTIAITDTSVSLNVTLRETQGLTGEVVVTAQHVQHKTLTTGVISVINRENMLDLYVVDETGKPVDLYDIYVERIFLDEDGEEDWEDLSPSIIEDRHLLRLYWNDDWGLKDEDGKPLKKATLRIEADGYKDMIVKVKYPKRNTKRTIRLRPEKE